MVFNNNLLLGAAGQGGGYSIDQSIRFNDDDSAYLYRAMGTGGNTKTGTISLWVKRANLGTTQIVFQQHVNNKNSDITFNSDNTITFYLQETAGAGYALNKKSSNLYRDVGGWYHIYATWDTTQSSPAWNLYVNGVQPTWATNSNNGMSQNADIAFFGNSDMDFGKHSTQAIYYLDAYLAEINCIEGSVVAISEFAETNADTGQWVPKEYTGSYPGKSFYITGADSASLGTDYSGNGNNFTSSGLTSADQVTDSPTDNFCTMSSINTYSGLTLADGNLKVSAGAQALNKVNGTFWVDADQGGAWYYEYTVGSNNDQLPGWTGSERTDKYPGQSTDSYSYAWARNGGAAYNPAGSTSAHTGSGTYASGDILGWLIDFDNNEVKVGKVASGTWSATITWTDLGTYKDGGPAGGAWTATDRPYNGNGTFNFGQTGGFAASNAPGQALKTSNLSAPTIALPDEHFNTVLYEGNGGGQRVGQFQPITETYTVPNSVIFNDDDLAYLARTPASAGNRKKFTISWWMKPSLAGVSTNDHLFGVYNGSGNLFTVVIQRDDATFTNELYIQSQVASVNVISKMTAQVFRDPSAWYHCVLAIDTDNGTAEDRNILYVNGTRVTNWLSPYTVNASSGHTTYWNNTDAHTIGSLNGISTTYYDGYMAEIYHIDGQALGPDSFGQLDASTNRWIPKDASGLTFGTNGFYLDMETAPGTGSGAGTDSSGNGNNFTESGLAAADQVIDTPTNNYAVLNPLVVGFQATLSNGNLGFSLGPDDGVCSSFATGATGTWRFRVNITALGAQGAIAVLTEDAFTAVTNWGSINLGGGAGQYAYRNNGDKYSGGTATAYGASFTAGDYVEAEYDADAGTLTFYKNGSSQGTAYTGLSGRMFLAFSRNASGGTSVDGSVDFGQLGTVGGTALALCTDNLPLTGGGLSSFVWIKNRDAADNNMLFDAVRGATIDLHSNSTAAEVTNVNTLTRFLKNGFEVGNDVEVNTSGESYVAWQWLNSSLSTSSNTEGDITSTVLANTTAGFSVVTYTPGTGVHTWGHGLGIAPSMVIVKDRGEVTNWLVYHASLGPTQKMILNLTNATATDSGIWNNTAPTSSVVTTGSGLNDAHSFVAYCFAEVEGFSKFGKYTGNGSADGPFVYCGFRPAFVMIKRTDSAGYWRMIDSQRDLYNVADAMLDANDSAAEYTEANAEDFLSNGFKIRTSASGALNASGGTFIYMAFAESPVKTANAR